MRKYLEGPLLGELPECSSQDFHLFIEGLLNLKSLVSRAGTQH